MLGKLPFMRRVGHTVALESHNCSWKTWNYCHCSCMSRGNHGNMTATQQNTFPIKPQRTSPSQRKMLRQAKSYALLLPLFEEVILSSCDRRCWRNGLEFLKERRRMQRRTVARTKSFAQGEASSSLACCTFLCGQEGKTSPQTRNASSFDGKPARQTHVLKGKTSLGQDGNN